jgi:hypothetical protein
MEVSPFPCERGCALLRLTVALRQARAGVIQARTLEYRGIRDLMSGRRRTKGSSISVWLAVLYTTVVFAEHASETGPTARGLGELTLLSLISRGWASASVIVSNYHLAGRTRRKDYVRRSGWD